MQPRLTISPLETYLGHLRQGEIAYQYDRDQNRAIFFPRVPAPGGAVEWRISAGRGTVHATTAVFPRGGTPYNVALIDLQEGFRMMSRVENVSATEVRIGDKVQARILPAEGDEAPLVVFDRVSA